MTTRVTDPYNLTHNTLARILTVIQAILWLDIDEDGDFWNPNKEWGVETIEEVSNMLTANGLSPKQETRAT